MSRRHAVSAATRVLLWGLTALFVLRIAAQPLAGLLPVLPSFAHWQGSDLPYPLLLALQLALLALMLAVNFYAGRTGLPHRPRLARALAILGVLYFAAMFARLFVGLLWADAPVWFQRPLPAFFHLVLASWLLLIARELWRPHVE
jgi:hypothetical protein